MERITQALRTGLERYDITVPGRELGLLLALAVKEGIARILGGTKRAGASKPRLTPFLRRLAKLGSLTGKWMGLYPKVFRLVLDALEEAGLAYRGEIIARRDEYGEREEMPVVIYVPSALSPSVVAGVASVLRRVLEGLRVYKGLFFKPDVFARKGMRSKAAGYEPCIHAAYWLRGATGCGCTSTLELTGR